MTHNLELSYVASHVAERWIRGGGTADGCNIEGGLAHKGNRAMDCIMMAKFGAVDMRMPFLV